MEKMKEKQVAQIVQNHTGFPWFNPQAYLNNKGINIKNQSVMLQHTVDDLQDVIEVLRDEKRYVLSDRLRVIQRKIIDEIFLHEYRIITTSDKIEAGLKKFREEG